VARAQTTRRGADPFAAVEPESVRNLLAAGLAAFAEAGFHATTTREISTRAGLSPAALYVHFPSKSDLLFEICKVGHDDVLAAVEAAVADAAGPPEAIEAFVRRFGEWHAVNHTLARVIQYELRSLEPEQLKRIATVRRSFNRILRKALREGVAAGDFVVADLSGTTLTILSIGIDVARWYVPGKGWSPRRVGNLQADLVGRMLAPA
jgi:AcrR family transcriptional regulator